MVRARACVPGARMLFGQRLTTLHTISAMSVHGAKDGWCLSTQGERSSCGKQGGDDDDNEAGSG